MEGAARELADVTRVAALGAVSGADCWRSA